MEITEKHIKTLKEEKKGWTYRIKVLGGNDIIGSEIPTKEEAILHCKKQLHKITLQMLK